jgi:hypothetical protein
MSVRDDLRDMLEGVPDERLDDVRTYLEHLREADAAWIAWQERYGGAGSDERVRAAVAEADADPRPSIPRETVVAWLRSWGTDNQLPPPHEH